MRKKGTWAALSPDAKTIVEWATNPFANQKECVELLEGRWFIRRLTTSRKAQQNGCKILITQDLISELIAYITSNSSFETVLYDLRTGKYVFRMRKDG